METQQRIKIKINTVYYVKIPTRGIAIKAKLLIHGNELTRLEIRKNQKETEIVDFETSSVKFYDRSRSGIL